MLVLCTYHPSALLYGSKDKGQSKDSVLGAIREDLLRVQELLAEKREVLSDPTHEVALPELPQYFLGIDTEFLSRGSSPHKMLTCSFSNGTRAWTWDQDLEGIDPVPLTKQCMVLAGHSLPEDVALLWERYLIPHREEWLRGTDLYDSLLIAKMHYEGWPSYKLEDVLATQYTVQGWKHETSDKDVTQWTPEERVRRCERDAWAPILINKALYPQLDTHTQQSLYPFTMGIAMTLHRLTLAGAVVDRPKFESLARSVEGERQTALDTLVHAASMVGVTDYDPANDHQTREILFDKLGFTPISYTDKTKEPQVTKEVLANLLEVAEGGRAVFLEALSAFNRYDKVVSTYLLGSENDKVKRHNAIAKLGVPIETEMGSVFWLPFRFNSLGAKTARRSSSNPNSQNWPKAIRRLVRSRWVGGKILAADYRKLEPIVVAWLADDDKLLSYFTTGEGYLGIAKDLLRTTVEEGTPLYRGVKSIVLGVHYDMQTEEMAKQLWFNHKIRFDPNYQVHWNETDRIRHLYLDAHPKLTAYMDRRRAELKATGVVRSPIGRIRHAGNEFVDKHILNQVINAPVQGTASDITGAALIGVEEAVLQEFGLTLTEWYDYLLHTRRKILTSGPGCGIMSFDVRVPTLFNEVHDELTVDLPPELEHRGTELVIETMRAVPLVRKLAPFLRDMPLDVDPKVGDFWSEG